MQDPKSTTVPIRCEACGQQTHKTLSAVREAGGMLCVCGFFTALNLDEFSVEIRKSEAQDKDFSESG